MPKFVTGSRDKFEEARTIVGDALEWLDIDLPEIQELDAREIIRRKLDEARRRGPGEYLVEDTSLHFECLGGRLPGPLIKWFLEAMGVSGLADIAGKMGDDRAVARTIVGFSDASGNISFFEGSVRGRVVRPRGDKDFGWGAIFLPDGSDMTFGELDRAAKHALSMRGAAFRQFKEYLISSYERQEG